MEYIKNKRTLSLAGVVCLILGMALPYFKVSVFGYSESFSLTKEKGWYGVLTVFLIAFILVLVFRDLLAKYVPVTKDFVKKLDDLKFKPEIIPIAITLIFAIYLVCYYADKVDGEFAKYTVGFYFYWLGIIALVAHVILYKPVKALASATPVAPTVENTPVEEKASVEENPVENTLDEMKKMVEEVKADTEQAASDVKYCQKCGNKVSSSAAFCDVCGNKFE